MPLTAMVLALMTLTAIGSYGLPTRTHLRHQVAAQEAADRDAATLAQRIALSETDVRDLHGRIARSGWTKTAMALVGRQGASYAALAAERQQAAERLADLKVQQANVEARKPLSISLYVLSAVQGRQRTTARSARPLSGGCRPAQSDLAGSV